MIDGSGIRAWLSLEQQQRETERNNLENVVPTFAFENRNHR